LNDLGIVPVLKEKVLGDGTPILGICLGMQLLTERSEEGQESGLGWINGETKRFDFGENRQRFKIPHMGWNLVYPTDRSSLFSGFTELPRFYFVHSYACVCRMPEDVLATAVYGYEFVCAVKRNNIYGTQFHPEKSHKYGMKLLKNFLEVV